MAHLMTLHFVCSGLVTFESPSVIDLVSHGFAVVPMTLARSHFLLLCRGTFEPRSIIVFIAVVPYDSRPVIVLLTALPLWHF
jgi:hypothetical protein